MQISNSIGRRHLRLLPVVLALLFLLAGALGAQRLDYIWYFGNSAGVDFRGANPQSIPGTTRTSEGVAVATDARTHRLVFYTDGVDVWDSTNTRIIADGLGGGRSSTQSALIVPVPGFDRRYYIFTSAEVEGDRNRSVGIRYSLLDFNLGQSYILVLNAPLLSPASEKLTAVGTCEGNSYWIITHSCDNNAFYTYKLTWQGLDPNPVISYVGPVLSTASSPAGFLVASPNGAWLAMASNTGGNYAGIFAFDNSRGTVSREIPLINTIDTYGACFSPDGSKVYFSSIGRGLVTQFDVSTDDSGTIARSGMTIYSGVSTTIGAIMSAVNNRLYIARIDEPTLDVIDYPNVRGPACSYRHDGFVLADGLSRSGLPNAIISFGGAASGTLGLPRDAWLCRGDSVQLRASGAGEYRWSPAAGLSCTNCANPVAMPESTTVYTVVGVLDSTCDRVQTVTVHVGQELHVVAHGPRSVCPGSEAQLVAEVEDDAFIQWTSNGDPPPCDTCHLLSVHPQRTTTYYLYAWTRGGCNGRDTITVVVDPNGLAVTATGSTTICTASDAQISVEAPPGSQVLWSPYETLDCDTCATTHARPTRTTMYYVDVFDSTGCHGRDSVLVRVDTAGIPVSVTGGGTICPGGGAVLSISDFLGQHHVRWSPKIGLSCDTCTTVEVRPTTTTVYRVEVWDDGGCRGEDSAVVVVDTTLVVNATGTLSVCPGGAASLDVDAPPGSVVHWSGEGLLCDTCVVTSARPTVTGVYYVEVKDPTGCRGHDSVEVRVKPAVQPLLLGGGTICPGDSVGIAALVPADAHVLWTPGTGLACDTCALTLARPLTTTVYRATVESADTCYALDSITVVVDSNGLDISILGTTSICPGASMELGLDAPPGVHIRWSSSGAPLACDTCRTNIVQPIAATEYRVECWTDEGCRGRDTLHVDVSNTGLPVDAGSDVDICMGETATLTAATPVSGVTAHWSPSTGLDCDTCLTVHATPLVTTTYIVEVQSGGCSGRDSVTVQVHQSQPALVGGGGDLCRGDSTTLSVVLPPGARVRWSPSAGLACDTCATTVARPITTTRYRAAVSGVECVAPDSIEVRVHDPVVIVVDVGQVVVRPGTSATVPMTLQGIPPGVSITGLELGVLYNPAILRLLSTSGVGSMRGWISSNEQSDWRAGEYGVSLTLPPGGSPASDGAVLELAFESFFSGDTLQSDVLVRSLRLTGLDCMSLLSDTGSVRLDSLCGRALRGIELLPFGSDKVLGVHPDPAGEEVHVRVNVGEEKEIELIAAGSTGMEQRLGGGSVVAGEHDLVVSVRDLPSGWYRLVVRDGERILGSRLLLVIH